MNRILLTKLIIKNFGPVQEDEVSFEPFTYFVGRNNAGKSHYLKAIETLLAAKAPQKEEIINLQNDRTKEISIEAHLTGVENFTSLVSGSNHKQAIEGAIKDGILKVIRVLDPNNEERTTFGIYKDDGTIHNPSGFNSNLLKILPECILIPATADTIDELKNTQNTALGKLKKEALTAFFTELRVQTQNALVNLDSFLHSQDGEQRSQELIKFEAHLKEELMGEFADVNPSITFRLPDEEIIAKEMKILLDDGHKCEVEQKGHGLQRATLLALLKVLAKHGTRYQNRPSPIFLIGELESFLHPFAQKQFAEVLNKLVDQYQIVTTTHSPFIVTPHAIEGYRRVRKNGNCTRSLMPNFQTLDINSVKRHLEVRGNLEGLFADRVILIEGDHDENFFEKLRMVFNIALPANKLTLFVKAGGKEGLRQAWKFYTQLGFDDVTIICDLDYLYSNDVKNLLKEIGIDENIPIQFRQHIAWTSNGDPALEQIIEKIKLRGEPTNFQDMLNNLENKRIFVLKKGAPEMYYANNMKSKNGWVNIRSESDLLEVEYLKELMVKILAVQTTTVLSSEITRHREGKFESIQTTLRKDTQQEL